MKIGSRIHTHKFIFKFSCLKLWFHALVYMYLTLSFTKMNIMFRSCMYTLSSILLSFLYFKTFFTKLFQSLALAVFLFQARPADRPGRPAPAQDMHVCACLSADRPGRPTVCRFALRFSGSTPGSTAFRNLCFFLGDGRPKRSTRAQRLFAS